MDHTDQVGYVDRNATKSRAEIGNPIPRPGSVPTHYQEVLYWTVIKKTSRVIQYHRQNEGEKELSSKIGFQLSHWKSSKQESSRWILSRYYRC